jgi:F420-dependent oxidoreductase-like protein
VVESTWDPFDKPASYMREYLNVLGPLLEGQPVDFHGEQLTAISGGPLAHLTQPVPVYVAALGPAMLKMTGELAAGTVTWMAGTKTISSHIVPKITAAAAAAGRPEPRVVVGLRVCVTDKPEAAKERIDKTLAMYPTLPSYRAMLDIEGAETASDVSFVGTGEEVTASVDRLSEAGATDFTVSVMGDQGERDRTWALFSQLAAR